MQTRSTTAACGLVLVWALSVGGGLIFLMRYENAPGQSADCPLSWPAASSIARIPGQYTLLVFAHPRCSCTQATLRELERLLAQEHEKLQVVVLMACPKDAGDDWLESPLVERALSLPHVQVVEDREAREATRFGVATSGQALLFDPTGRLRFQGGITPSRAHSGDNAGRSAILSVLQDNQAVETCPSAAVFGCALRADESVAGSDR